MTRAWPLCCLRLWPLFGRPGRVGVLPIDCLYMTCHVSVTVQAAVSVSAAYVLLGLWPGLLSYVTSRSEREESLHAAYRGVRSVCDLAASATYVHEVWQLMLLYSSVPSLDNIKLQSLKEIESSSAELNPKLKIAKKTCQYSRPKPKRPELGKSLCAG